MAKNINIGGRLHSIATGNVIAGADEILDDEKGKKQSEINAEIDITLAELKDKVYSSILYSGLGRKYLRKNIVNNVNTLTQSMLDSENTIYIIQYDYDLNGQIITIPKNCVLKFEGGSVINGYINCNNAELQNVTNYSCLYNYKYNVRKTQCKIYYSFGSGDIRTFERYMQDFTRYIPKGCDGYVSCFSLDSNCESYGESRDNLYNFINFTKRIGVKCHAVKIHITTSNFIATPDNILTYTSKIKEYIDELYDNCGLIDYIAIGNENSSILNPSDSYVIQSIKDLVDYIKNLGYNVLMNPTEQGLLYQVNINNNYNPSALSCNFYPNIGGCYGSRTEEDVLEYIRETKQKIACVKTKCNKNFIFCESGISDYEECFYKAAAYDYDNLTRNYEVPYIYWKGFFDSGMGDVVSEVWVWFKAHTGEKVKALFKELIGK